MKIKVLFSQVLYVQIIIKMPQIIMTHTYTYRYTRKRTHTHTWSTLTNLFFPTGSTHGKTLDYRTLGDYNVMHLFKGPILYSSMPKLQGETQLTGCNRQASLPICYRSLSFICWPSVCLKKKRKKEGKSASFLWQPTLRISKKAFQG